MYGRHAHYPAVPPPGAVHYRQRGVGAATLPPHVRDVP